MDRRTFLQILALAGIGCKSGRAEELRPLELPRWQLPVPDPKDPPEADADPDDVKKPPAAPGAVSDVYFTKEVSPAAVMRVYEKIAHRVKGNVALKVHFGEDGNPNFLSPNLMKELALHTKATFVETNVLYVGRRRYTESHIQLAREHGFTYAPIDILDSEADLDLKVTDPRLKHFKEVKVGKNMDKYDTYIVFSHFKGHGSAGFGGAIKNVAMGFGSIAGKMAQHASDIPTVDEPKCVRCKKCVEECPADAITVREKGSPKVKIHPEKCIGCAKCIGVCPTRVFGIPWRSTDRPVFHERLVEYAKVIADRYPMVFITVMANISKGCDCARSHQKPFMGDVGILASLDMLAIENAAHDLVNRAAGHEDVWLDKNSVSGRRQLSYAAAVGLGNTHYNLIDLDAQPATP